MIAPKRRRVRKVNRTQRTTPWHYWRAETLEDRCLLTGSPTIAPASGQVAIGDFNGDGVPDEAVVAADIPAAVSIRYGQADGSYKPAINLLPGRASDSIAAGDFTGNGELDLAVLRRAVPGVSPAVVIVFMNQGNFEFTLNSVEIDNNNPTSIAAGDVTGDGKISLAMTTAQGDVEVRLGNADGTFQAPQVYHAAANVDHLAVADFNGDGKPDIVATSQADSKVSILPGQGNATFPAAITTNLNPAPTSFVLADFNGDGLLDLATTNAGKNGTPSQSVSIHVNLGFNAVDTALAFPVSNTPIAITAGDVNGDGKLDIVTANSRGNNVSVVLGDGQGSLGETHDFALPAVPLGVGLADTNHDSKLDILAPTSASSDRVVAGHGDGTFNAPPGYYTGAGAIAALYAKIDTDALTNDFVTLTPTGFLVRLLKADGTYAPSVGYLASKTPISFAIADMNGDGNNDIVIAEAGQIEEFFGTGQGTFTNGPITPARANPGPIQAADFSGTGTLEVVEAFSDPGAPSSDPFALGGLATFRVNANGTLTNLGAIAIGAPITQFAVGDMNGDGHTDIVVGSTTNKLVMLTNNVSGTFNDISTLTTPVLATRIAIGDFNGDHKADIAVLDNSSGAISLLSPFTAVPVSAITLPVSAGPNATGLVAADVDGDGKLDLTAIRNNTTDPNVPQAGRVEVLRGHGDGTFQAPVSLLVGASPIAIATPRNPAAGRASLVVVNADSFDVTPLSNVPLDLTLPQGVDITGVKGLLVPGLQPATFVDANVSAAASQYSAVIDWGDGTTTLGTIKDLGTLFQGTGPRIGEQFGVVGDHKYLGDGPYTVHVIITKSDGESVETLSTAHIVANPLTVTAKNLTVVEGQPLFGEFATFTDLVNEPTANFTVTLDWGAIAAPTSANVTATSDFFSQTYHVSNTGLSTATFAKPGTYSVLVKITDSSGFNSTVTSTVTVTDAVTHLNGLSTNIPTMEYIPLRHITVGMFTDGNPLAVPGDFAATIDWGDGTVAVPGTIDATTFPSTTDPNTGALVPGYTLFTIDGDHTYTSPGNFTIQISLTDISAGATHTASSTAHVTPFPLTLYPAPPPFVAARGRLTGGAGLLVGTFVDGGGAHAPSDFHATVDWGDGSSTANASVGIQGIAALGSPSPPTLFYVKNDHIYNSAGAFTVTVTVRDNLGQTKSIQETIHVAPTPINLAGHLDPGSDTGISNSDGITNDNHPNYLGTSEAATIVSLYAINTTGGGPFLIGQTTTDGFGHWQMTTSTLADGTYNIVATAVTPSGGASAQTNLAPLTIDTAPPRVLNVVINARLNQATIVMQAGPAGIDLGSLSNAGVYNLSMISARPSRVYASKVIATNYSASPTAAISVTLSFQNGKRLANGQYVLSITPGGLTDRAGNALNGTYNGTFPTSGGPATGSFAVKFKTDGRSVTLLPVAPKPPVVRKTPKPKAHK